MVKQFLVMMAAVVGLAACSGGSGTKIPVYGWQGEGGDATEASIQADFSQDRPCQWVGISCLDSYYVERRCRFYLVCREPEG